MLMCLPIHYMELRLVAYTTTFLHSTMVEQISLLIARLTGLRVKVYVGSTE